jgi:hypothetical protein
MTGLNIDPFGHPELIPPYDCLDAKEKEKIRQGCIQLQDGTCVKSSAPVHLCAHVVADTTGLSI